MSARWTEWAHLSYDSGARGRYAGRTIDAHAYRPGTDEADWFEDGWNDADAVERGEGEGTRAWSVKDWRQ